VIRPVARVVRGWCRVWISPPLRLADLVASVRAGENELCLIRHRRESAMAEPHLDHPGDIQWFKGKGPTPVVGPCPHDCKHLGQGVIAWGPTMDRYELVECRIKHDEEPDGCAGRCRAWVDGQGRVTTDWLTVDFEAAAAVR
jgi:hypothetical protein